jgi:hypothetical protein
MLTKNACFLRKKIACCHFTLSASLVYVLGEESEPNLKINSYLSLCSSEFMSALVCLEELIDFGSSACATSCSILRRSEYYTGEWCCSSLHME